MLEFKGYLAVSLTYVAYHSHLVPSLSLAVAYALVGYALYLKERGPH